MATKPDPESLKKNIEKVERELLECHKAREEYFKKSEFMKTVLESLPHPFYVIDANDYTVKVANSAALKSASLGKSKCYALTHKTDSPCVSDEHPCPLELVKKTKQPAVVEHIHYDQDGKPLNVEVHGFPIFDDNGDVVEMIEYSIDITQRKEAEQQLAHMATHDTLTGLPNRKLFSLRLQLELAHAQRNSNKLAVIMIDLDKFKEVNDTLGHNIGDKLLQQVGDRLLTLTRKSDTVARMGGDEFLLLLPELNDAQDAVTIAEKLTEAFREPFGVDNHVCSTTLSAGIAIFPDDGDAQETLIKYADIAMYAAKKRGGDGFARYDQAGN